MTITCPHCRKALKGKDEWAGRSVTCPACKQPFEVPIRAAAEDTQGQSCPPPGPHVRLPPSLAKYCPDPAVVKQRTRLWVAKCLSFLSHWLARFGNVCTRNWAALDQAGRLTVACLGIVTLCLALLAIGGWSRRLGDGARHEWKSDYRDTIDHRVAEAYEMQKRFVMQAFALAGKPKTFQSGSSDESGFSPLEETRIVREGNLFRIKGWFQVRGGDREDYVCEMRFDPGLEVWKLVGHVEEVH